MVETNALQKYEASPWQIIQQSRMISCRGLVYLSKTSDLAVTDSAVWEADAKVEGGVQKAYWGIIPVKEKGKKKDGATEGITLCLDLTRSANPIRCSGAKIACESHLGPLYQSFSQSWMEEHKNITSA